MTKPNTARQFWIQEPGRGEIRTRELGPRPDGHLRIRALYSAISRGTESLVFQGRVPPSQREAMRAPFQEGDFPAPVKYGYMSVGQVEAGRKELEGRPVFCLHPHQDLYDVPAEAVTPLPDGVPAARAVLAAQVETAVTAVWDGGVSVGDRVMVVGAGVVGLLVAYLCRRIPGTRVTAVDPESRRREPARTLGLELESDPPSGAHADVVVHASGAPSGLRDALELVGRDGTLVEASWYGDRSVSLPLGEDFHARRIVLRSSQVGHIPPERTPRWDRARRRRLAVELLADDALDALVSGESPFEALPEVMERVSHDPGGTLCHRIRYPAAGD